MRRSRRDSSCSNGVSVSCCWSCRTLVFDIRLAASADELQVGDRAVAGGDDYQLPVVSRLFGGVQTEIERRERQEGLFGDGAEPVLHGSAPTPAVGELCDKLIEVRQGVDVELGLEAHTSGIGQLQVQDHHYRGDSAGRYAALEQRPDNGAEVRHVEEIELKRRANPEAHSGNYDLLLVLLALDDGLGAVDEKGCR